MFAQLVFWLYLQLSNAVLYRTRFSSLSGCEQLPSARLHAASIPANMSCPSCIVQQYLTDVMMLQALGTYAYSPPSVSPASSSLSPSPRPSPRGSPRASHRVASLTDVIDVTENYSGAMRTANERIQHASSDAALAQLMAEKQELERQLKVRMTCQSACACHYMNYAWHSLQLDLLDVHQSVDSGVLWQKVPLF